jgi:hypothetical protein
MTQGRKSKRPSVGAFSRGESVVKKALAALSGRPNPRYPMWFLRQRDQLSTSRYIRLVSGRGGSIAKTVETYLDSIAPQGGKQQQHARRVAATLQTWCRIRIALVG